MKRSIFLFQLLGFAVTSLGGTLLHFLYEWTNESIWAAPFSGINESTWEHMKLLFFPMLLYAIVQSFLFRDRPDFWCIKLKGILLGLLLIPVIFYTYNGAVGPSPDWLNIAIFFISAAVAYFYETRLFKKAASPFCSPKLALILLCILTLLFVLFTFFPPRIGIFQDPVSRTYGIPL